MPAWIGYGLINAGWGGGAALGSFLAQRYLRERYEARALIWGSRWSVFCLGLIGIAPWLWSVVGLMVGAGVGEGVGGVAEQGICSRTPSTTCAAASSANPESAIPIALALSPRSAARPSTRSDLGGAYFVGGPSRLVAALRPRACSVVSTASACRQPRRVDRLVRQPEDL